MCSVTGLGLVLAGIAALIHIYIFVLESFGWTGERARKLFGTTPEQASTTRELAYNQGFYNLFLAIMVAAGIVFYVLDRETIGITLVLAGSTAMAAAGSVLLLSSPEKASSAIKQLTPPLLAVILVAVSLLLR